ncbi:hypothetical protein KJ786_02760 [Patescibacteria group bacterium]|nr:hypothetical protein [Patescibacteria group bacterium]
MSNNIIISWFFWHFYEAPKFLLKVWKNYIQFSVNFFSTPLLFKTLFSPWRRYKWGYPRGFDLMGYFETITSNIFSRFIGAICRITLIIVGVIFQICVFLFGAIVFVGWLLLPLLSLAGLLFVLNIL